jgi:SAM-dependent methyltransferase
MNETERVVEIPWLLSKLNHPNRILDIGSCDATYLPDLLTAGAAEVWALDVRPFQAPPGVRAVVCSAAEMPSHWTGYFDLLTCVSVIDHVGLDAYGQAEQPGLLEQVCAEMYRVLAPGGRLLLTVPFGRDHTTTHPGGGQRVFGLPALQDLFPLTRWDDLSFSVWRLEGDIYQRVPINRVWKDAAQAEYAGHRAGAVIALELEKLE